MATDEVVTLPAGGKDDTRSVQLPEGQLPEGWIERALAQARRIGRQVGPDPVVPAAEPPEQGGEVEYRYVNGRRVHPSWPPGYIEWLDEMRETGELEIGDPDELRWAFNNPQPE